MASNKYTQGTPLSGASTKAVIAERAYVAANTTAYNDPAARLDGSDPAGFSDLGIVAGSKVTIAYNKETKFVETGIEKVRRGAYITSKSAQATFTLEQFDVDTLTLVSGQSTIAVGAIGGKVHVGPEDVIRKAVLFIGTNKVDNKEIHTFCKDAALSFNIGEADDARVINVTADLFAFQPVGGSAADTFFTVYVFEAS